MKITDAAIRQSCSPTIYKRGMEYFNEGRVHLKKRTDNLITAVADGEKLYNVSVHLDDSGNVTDSFCTCPYYETMHSTCKHIVATLQQRRSELEEGLVFTDENDKIAASLCRGFTQTSEDNEPLNIHFTLYITNSSFEMSIELGDGGTVHGIENFLEMYATHHKFKSFKSVVYDPSKSSFTQYEHQLLSILAESCENRAVQNPMYTKSVSRTSFGHSTLMRIFDVLQNVDFSVVVDGMALSDVRFLDEDPDIIVDLRASDTEITLAVSDRGLALSRNGEYFLHDNIIYKPSKDFLGYYMPIYRALEKGKRTQISFKGDNKIMFASQVLPKIRGRHGVVSHDIDELIINERPSFTVYFDAPSGNVSAVIIAEYGSVPIRIGKNDEPEDKIIVRDKSSEDAVLSFFTDFAGYDGTYTLKDDALIYSFLKYSLPRLSEYARLVFSDSFKTLQISDTIDIWARVSYNSHADLLEADFDTDLEIDEIYAILAAVKLRETHYRRQNGSFISLEDNKKRYVFDLLEQLEFAPSDIEKRHKLIPKYHSLYLDAAEGIQKDKSFIEYIESIKRIKPNIPPHLDDVLRFYQKDGIKWLKQLSSLGFGGILADDMGLGKTLQVLAFLEGENPDAPALIVAPSALVYNWENEISRFTPNLKTLVADGVKEDREKLISNAEDYDVIITSYPLLRRDISLYREHRFSYCFIDEAQYIKNPKTMNARSVKKIHAEHKFAVTGTPIENSLSELWSIFDFIMDGYLYDMKTFSRMYEIPIVKEHNQFVFDDLKTKINPFILRRMKSEVLSELPEKMQYTMYAELTTEQKKMYSSYLSLAKNRTISLLKDGSKNKMQILTLLMRLRQICCHPSLFDENYTHDSGKLQLLCELAESAVLSGHRLLIFSQYTSMLEIIRKELTERKLKCFYLDGQTPSYERLEMADRFNGGDRDIFLISLKAGGTGLNLTGADMVIHYDPWWNPAVTDQASDRAYRIGQTKDVQVIYLAAKNTIEEKILKLHEAKRSLADNMIAANNKTFASLTNEEIIALFE